MGQGLYPRVCQKSLDIDVAFGLHKQLIENIVIEKTLPSIQEQTLDSVALQLH